MCRTTKQPTVNRFAHALLSAHGATMHCINIAQLKETFADKLCIAGTYQTVWSQSLMGSVSGLFEERYLTARPHHLQERTIQWSSVYTNKRGWGLFTERLQVRSPNVLSLPVVILNDLYLKNGLSPNRSLMASI